VAHRQQHLPHRLADSINLIVSRAHRSDLAGGTGCRWLMLAAETADLAFGDRRPPPVPPPAGWACLPRIATRALGADPGSVRAARDFTVAILHRWSAAERSPYIAVVVSELLTNALRHALPGSGDARPRRPVRLGLLQLRACVLCAVADPSTAAPVPRTPGTLAETGRGLHIVCALSDQWGYTTSGTGKVVWAMFTAQLTEPSAL
jgi:anti-sigma regulatory factor (Ser/Thr protein kinase)